MQYFYLTGILYLRVVSIQAESIFSIHDFTEILMLVGGTDDGHRAGAYSRLDPGCTAESSPVLTLTYLRISLSDNRNLSDGSSRHDAKARPIGLLGGEKP